MKYDIITNTLCTKEDGLGFSQALLLLIGGTNPLAGLAPLLMSWLSHVGGSRGSEDKIKIHHNILVRSELLLFSSFAAETVKEPPKGLSTAFSE